MLVKLTQRRIEAGAMVETTVMTPMTSEAVTNFSGQLRKEKDMSLMERYQKAMNDKNEDEMNDILHDDFKFTMHASGNVLSKSDVVSWAMSDDINSDKDRIVYENDEIAVLHAFVTFNDGNTQAVMSVFKIENGKIVSLETGATNMPK